MRSASRVDWKFLLVALCFLVAVILTSCSGHSGEQPEEILIGEYGSLTGSTATIGISTKNGIDMAQDKANKSGGVLGKDPESLLEQAEIHLNLPKR